MIRVYQGLDYKWYVRANLHTLYYGRFDTLIEALSFANSIIG